MTTIREKNAKQGRKGQPVLKVLLAALALALVAWLVTELFFEGPDRANDGMVPSAPIESTDG